MCPAYVEDSHLPGQTPGVPDRTVELLAKLLSGSEDAHVTALSEAVRAKLGIIETLPHSALASSSPGLSTLADDLKRSRVSRLLLKVTCPSPFQCHARTVTIAELQDVPVTETEKKGLTALAPLAGGPTPGSDPTSGGGKSGKPIAQANIWLELPEFHPKNLPEWAEKFAVFLSLTGQSHVRVTTNDAFPWGAWPQDVAAGTHKQAGRQSTALTSLMLVSCDKAFQDPCHSETREQKYVQQHIRICTHGVKTGLG